MLAPTAGASSANAAGSDDGPRILPGGDDARLPFAWERRCQMERLNLAAALFRAKLYSMRRPRAIRIGGNVARKLERQAARVGAVGQTIDFDYLTLIYEPLSTNIHHESWTSPNRPNEPRTASMIS